MLTIRCRPGELYDNVRCSDNRPSYDFLVSPLAGTEECVDAGPPFAPKGAVLLD